MAQARHIDEAERVEAALDAFTQKHAREAEDAERIEELWTEAERKEREKQRWVNGWGWIRHHEGLARVHRGLAQEHDAKATHVRQLLGMEVTEPSRNGHYGGDRKGDET